MNTPERILQLLDRRGPLSGSDLGAEIGVSRQAIHVHVRKLSADGLLLKEGATRGTRYRLTPAGTDAAKSLHEASIASDPGVAHLPTVIAAMPIGMLVYELVDDQELILREANPAARHVVRRDVSRLIGSRLQEVSLLGETPEMLEVYRDLARGPGVWRDDAVVIGSGGDATTYELRLFHTPPQHTTALFSEVTRRTRMQQELLRNRREHAEAQRLAHVGSYSWRVGQAELSWSDELRRILGRPAVVPSAESMLACMHPDDRVLVGKEVEALLTHGVEVDLQYRIVRPDGEVRTVRNVSSVECDHNGAPVLIYGSLLDVTEVEQAARERQGLREQVLKTQKMESLGVLAGGIAHDFNNILCGVLGYVELAMDGMGADESEAREDLQMACRSIDRATALCQQMLAYSGRGRFVVEPVDLTGILEDMSALLDVSVSKKVRLQRDFGHGLPFIDVDTVQIRQMVLNIVVNASESIGESAGEIVLRTGTCSAGAPGAGRRYLEENLATGSLLVYVEVEDTGCGIASRELDRIFDPFFSTKFTGRGLGLAAALGIVKGHGGAILVDSVRNRGTRFRVVFPARPADEGTPLPSAEQAEADGGILYEGHVLLVDDEESVRGVALRFLERLGFTVAPVGSGEAAIEAYREAPEKFSLVMLDLSMPVLGGDEVFDQLRKIDPSVRVVLSSGYDAVEAGQRFANREMAGFLQKPFSLARMREVIAAALDWRPE